MDLIEFSYATKDRLAELNYKFTKDGLDIVAWGHENNHTPEEIATLMLLITNAQESKLLFENRNSKVMEFMLNRRPIAVREMMIMKQWVINNLVRRSIWNLYMDIAPHLYILSQESKTKYNYVLNNFSEVKDNPICEQIKKYIYHLDERVRFRREEIDKLSPINKKLIWVHILETVFSDIDEIGSQRSHIFKYLFTQPFSKELFKEKFTSEVIGNLIQELDQVSAAKRDLAVTLQREFESKGLTNLLPLAYDLCMSSLAYELLSIALQYLIWSMYEDEGDDIKILWKILLDNPEINLLAVDHYNFLQSLEISHGMPARDMLSSHMMQSKMVETPAFVLTL